MRWVTFERNGKSWPGLLDDDERIIDVQKALAMGGHTHPVPDSLLEIVNLPEGLRRTLVEAVANAPAEARQPLARARLRAPIERPGKLICIAGNYREHIVESGQAPVAQTDVITPQMFLKPSTCITGDDADIVLRDANVTVGWEVELAVVVGTRGRDIAETQAMDHVFGYAVLNDLSERALNATVAGRRTRANDPFFDWLAGKWFDGFAPCGPWLVTRDEIADPHGLDLRLRVNGELRQAGNTAAMIFRIPALIAAASAIMTLEPGDIIATGTPAGAGMGQGDSCLKAGDLIECEVAGLGTLRNRVVAPATV